MPRLAVLASVVLAASPAFAGLASRSVSDDEITGTAMQGLYAGLGGGGQLMIFDGGGNSFGWDVEGRLGYSFNPGLQLYASGALDQSSPSDIAVRLGLVAVNIQYHLYSKPGLGVYGRFGIGLGWSLTGNDSVGLSEMGGIGMEIGLRPDVFIAPEFFYKNFNLSYSDGSGETRVSVIGLSLSVIYY